jgi:hypothetical protein
MDRFGLSLLVALAGLVLLLYGFQGAAFVRYQAGAQVANKSWVWLDALDYVDDAIREGRFEGWLHVPDSGLLWIENNTGADLKFTVDTTTIYQGTEPVAVTLDDWRGQIVPFRFEYRLLSSFPAAGRIGLLEEGISGIRYVVTPWSFAPPETGSNPLMRIARPLSLIIVALAAALMVASLRLTRGHWLWLAVILVLSITARFITLSEKLDNDPGILQMATIWDNFVLMGRGLMSGSLSLTGYYPQGNIVYMGLLQLILGPNVAGLYWVQTALGAFVPVLLTLAGWTLFSRLAGVAAGVLSALYAPLIHFQHTLILDSPAIILTALVMLGLIAFFRWQQWTFLILTGLGIGVMTVFRGAFAVIGLWPLLVIGLMTFSWRQKLAAAGLVTFCAVLPVSLPIFANLSAGNAWLTPSRSDFQFFRANNRDAIGFNTFKSQSELLAEQRHMDWIDALLLDFRRYPTRFFELTLRRLALFFEAVEHSSDNHAAYFTTGLSYSPTLRLLSLSGEINFRIISLAALAALVLGWHTPYRRNGLIVAAGIIAFMLSLSYLYVEGRTRISGAVPTLLLAAALPALLWELRRDQRLFRYLAQAGIAVGLLVLGVSIIHSNFPRLKVTTPDQLPYTFVPVSGTYNDEIRLLGYGYYDTDFLADGYVTFELYWQPLRQPAKDYTVTIRLVDSVTNEVADIYNTQLAIHAPTIYSSQWQPDTVYVDRYLVTLPDTSEPQAYSLYVGVFDTDTQRVIPITDAAAEVQDNHLRLTGVSVNDMPTSSPNAAGQAVWDDTLVLRSAACSVDVDLTVELQWQALQRPERPWHLFVHVFDMNVTLLDQQDGALEPDMPLDTWPPGRRSDTEWVFENVAGPVQVKVGFYDVFTGERWSMTQGGNPAEDLFQFSCGD